MSKRKATLHEKKIWIIVSNKTIVLRKIIEGYKVIMLNKIIELICRFIEIKKNLKIGLFAIQLSSSWKQNFNFCLLLNSILTL